MEAIDPSHGLGKAAGVLDGIVGWWFCWTRLDTHLSTAFGIMRIFFDEFISISIHFKLIIYAIACCFGYRRLVK